MKRRRSHKLATLDALLAFYCWFVAGYRLRGVVKLWADVQWYGPVDPKTWRPLWDDSAKDGVQSARVICGMTYEKGFWRWPQERRLKAVEEAIAVAESWRDVK